MNEDISPEQLEELAQRRKPREPSREKTTQAREKKFSQLDDEDLTLDQWISRKWSREENEYRKELARVIGSLGLIK
jgi:hypothetical protein